MSVEGRSFWLAILAGAPGSLAALALLWSGDASDKLRWTVGLVVVAVWWGAAFAARERVIWPLRTLANLLAALREGDYTVRGRGGDRRHSLGEVLLEVNALSAELQARRVGELEAGALLEKVMEEIDVAVLAFDGGGALRLVNRAGAALLGRPVEQLVGKGAEALGLAELLVGPAPRTLERAPGGPAAGGRWELRRTAFRLGGLPHELVVLADLQRARREEERVAWQRLVRVLGHEINNSLAPIQSIAGTLKEAMGRRPRPSDWEEDLAGGLEIISRRSEALGRFLTAYAKLARLPPPSLRPVAISPLIERVIALETRRPVERRGGPEVMVDADPDQLEQLLINLVRNAVDAALETGGRVWVGWHTAGEQLEIVVSDEGPGAPASANLFVPFFTTKPQGSGIGLALCRQIAEAHGGTIALTAPPGRRGCDARLTVPLGAVSRRAIS